jgi:hypothetical protein
MDNLSSCVQGFSSVDAYAARYSKLASHAGEDFTAAHIIRGFWRGLVDPTLRQLLSR